MLAALLLVLSGLAGPSAVSAEDPPLPVCSNLLDDDGDGLIDMLDPGCTDPLTGTSEADKPPAPPPPVNDPPACSNGKDDDDDGKIDAADPGCTSATDDSETDPAPAPPADEEPDDGEKPPKPPSDDRPPTAAFDVVPAQPMTGQDVTFTARSAAAKGRDVVALRWDLDGDGAFDDAAGAQVTRRFGRSGPVTVGLQAQDDHGAVATAARTIDVQNRPPVASFELSPGAPVAGTRVRFVSTAADPDGPIARVAWDLNADGRFGEGTRTVAARRFSKPGSYVVRLRATDDQGAQAVAERTVVVAEAAPMSPSPVVRLAGRFSQRGVTVSVLSVDAPRGARIVVRCRGRGCPARRIAATAQLRRFHRFERRLPVGVRLEIRVTKPASLGRFTSFRIRRARPPMRRDRCLRPGSTRPIACPP